ncbi:hypothetical protein CKAH01_17261 [Colletotrichum kahawae]|uniref:Uncharacterized protein n=1 Tax=Colletotrichum kahawae TaxID=34407 RepID=A0AAD9YAH7_COLKA|nr:hypothetical protein CKAH01_17261 [Colletotrichum kahawae]
MQWLYTANLELLSNNISKSAMSRARARPRPPALPEQLPRSGSAGSTILPWHTA